VDEPARGLKVLGVFFALSIVFCLMLKWVLRRAIAQALRPIGAAKVATSRLVSIGEEGGKKVFRSLGKRTRDAGSTLTWAVGGAARTLWRVRYVWPSNWRDADGMMRKSLRTSFRSREIKRAADLRARSREFFHLSG